MHSIGRRCTERPTASGVITRTSMKTDASTLLGWNVEIDAIAAHGAKPFVMPDFLLRSSCFANLVRENELLATAWTPRRDECRFSTRPRIGWASRLVVVHGVLRMCVNATNGQRSDSAAGLRAIIRGTGSFEVRLFPGRMPGDPQAYARARSQLGNREVKQVSPVADGPNAWLGGFHYP
jgi:hypothetical protein